MDDPKSAVEALLRAQCLFLSGLNRPLFLSEARSIFALVSALEILGRQKLDAEEPFCEEP